MLMDDKLIISISSSCPNLRWLSLKGVLNFSSSGGEAMRVGLGKLQALTLQDTRRQAVQQLAGLAAVTDAAAEPEQEEEVRLQQLQAAKEELWVDGGWLGCCMCLLRVRRRVAGWLAGVMFGVSLAATPWLVYEVLVHAVWGRQQQVARQLRDSACGLQQLPRVMCCWLPPQLELLQLTGCCLESHKGRCCRCSVCDAAEPSRSATHWLSLDTVPLRANGSGSITLMKRPGDRSRYSGRSSSRHAVLQHHSSLADAAAAAAGPAAQLPVQQALQQAAQPCVQLQRRLRGDRVRSLGGLIVRPLVRSMAVGSSLGLVLRWCVR
jgi:hypothetical protein